jgi:hypothetical protein
MPVALAAGDQIRMGESGVDGHKFGAPGDTFVVPPDPS